MKVDILVEKGGSRIDKFLADSLDLSRSEVNSSIKKGDVLIDGKTVKPSYKLKKGEAIRGQIVENSINLSPYPMDINIVYEDDYLLAINKGPNLVVHPSPSTRGPTLVNGLLAYSPKLSNMGGEDRPGIVHRLDKDTTGLILVAKDNPTHQALQDLFKDRMVKKTYLAIVHGRVDGPGRIDLPIGRDEKTRVKMAVEGLSPKEAFTSYRPLDANDTYSLVELKIITGRTHQIRVHMAYINHHILGDDLYGIAKEKIKTKHQMLHASSLEFTHPSTGQALRLVAGLDWEFKSVLAKCSLSLPEMQLTNTIKILK